MEQLPIYTDVVFGLTTLLTVALFYKANHGSKVTLIILLTWMSLQVILGLTGFYRIKTAFPPRFLFMVVPPMIFIICLFVTPIGRRFLDNLSPKHLTLLHVVRIPVEMVLFWLYIYKTVPVLMTFEGRNFDILSGLTAPFIYYFGFIKKQLNRTILLIWNFVCLGLLINIVVTAVLSAPLPFQKLAFEQPNIAVLYFPYNWLPSCVVPLVLLSHLASIRKLLKAGKNL